MSKTDSKKISAAAWILIQSEHVAGTKEPYSAEMAYVIMSAAAVEGKRTEAEWDSLFAAAIEAEETMVEAAKFG